MIIENIVGTMSSGAAINTFTNESLFDLLASGGYKTVILPDYFPEVSYMKEDDVLFMRSTLYTREDLTPAFYWYLAFDEKGNYTPEVTSGYIALGHNSNLLHIKAMHRVSYDDIKMRHDTYEGITIIGCYSLNSDKYVLSGGNTPVITRSEYNEDGSVLQYGTDTNDSKSLYVPANDTASAVAKSNMYKMIDSLKAGKVRLPDPY